MKATFDRYKALIQKKLIAQTDYDLAEYNYNNSLASLKNAKSVAVLDRCAPMGSTGHLFNDVAATMLDHRICVPALDYIYGLGGRDTTIAHLEKVYADLAECSKTGKRAKPLIQMINLRGKELSFF